MQSIRIYFKVAWKEWENNLGGLYLTDQTPIGEDFAESVRRQSPCADVLSQVYKGNKVCTTGLKLCSDIYAGSSRLEFPGEGSEHETLRLDRKCYY